MAVLSSTTIRFGNAVQTESSARNMPRTTILSLSAWRRGALRPQNRCYLEYAAGDPASARDDFARAIEQSRIADNADSTVFPLLPALELTDPERFRTVPPESQEGVTAAQRKADRPMLAVLSQEVAQSDWRFAGLWLVAMAHLP